MPTKLTDKENALLSKVAYQNIDARYNLIKHKYPGGKVPLRDLLTKKQLKEFDGLGGLGNRLDTWKVVASHDTNSSNGFAACVVETEPGKAAVAFRGSEGMLDRSNIVHDWSRADLALLNEVQTAQHAEVDRFLRKYKDTLGGYDDIEMMGHSLGGNLAQYATIVSDKYGLDSRITQCTSLDGPGFNKEFRLLHASQIRKMSSRMTHYRWSLVGNCLPNPAGTDINAKVKDSERSDVFGRHDMAAVDFRDNGSIQQSQGLDPFDGSIVSVITGGLDLHTPGVKTEISIFAQMAVIGTVFIITGVRDAFDWVKQKVLGAFSGKASEGAARGVGGGHGGRGSGGGRKDRLLVSTEQMRQTLTRYSQAKATLDQATQRMDTAWTRLSGVWEGSSKAAFMAQWVLLQGNIRKSHMAIDRSIRGLERAVGLFEETESANTSRAEGLDPGTVPPLF